jgi:hypothetical protein
MRVQSAEGSILMGKKEELREKHVPVPFYPPQIPRGLTQAQTQRSVIRGQRLSAQVMAWPNKTYMLHCS